MLEAVAADGHRAAAAVPVPVAGTAMTHMANTVLTANQLLNKSHTLDTTKSLADKSLMRGDAKLTIKSQKMNEKKYDETIHQYHL